MIGHRRVQLARRRTSPQRFYVRGRCLRFPRRTRRDEPQPSPLPQRSLRHLRPIEPGRARGNGGDPMVQCSQHDTPPAFCVDLINRLGRPTVASAERSEMPNAHQSVARRQHHQKNDVVQSR
jgi:hypothetical protein